MERQAHARLTAERATVRAWMGCAAPPGAEVLLERWRRLPALDPDHLREDLDGLLDPTP